MGFKQYILGRAVEGGFCFWFSINILWVRSLRRNDLKFLSKRYSVVWIAGQYGLQLFPFLFIKYWILKRITKLRSLPNSKSICGGNDEGDHKAVCPVCGEEGGQNSAACQTERGGGDERMRHRWSEGTKRRCASFIDFYKINTKL
jgi:hypothetical protein